MKPTPKDWPRLSSAVFYRDAAAAIDWLCAAFDLQVRTVRRLVRTAPSIPGAIPGGSRSACVIRRRDEHAGRCPFDADLEGSFNAHVIDFERERSGRQTRRECQGANLREVGAAEPREW